MRVCVAFGTRPEAIKLAPVLRALRAEPRFAVACCCLGQHRELVDAAVEPGDLAPDYDLDLMRPGQTPAELAARAMRAMDGLLAELDPELCIVQGDTSAAMAAGFAAFHRGVGVAHVEAGLRSGDPREPFPEEANRRMLTALSDLHFAPTREAAQTLLREGVAEEAVFVTGNPGIDALFAALAAPVDVPGAVDRGPARPLVVVTLHRRETFAAGLLGGLCDAIAAVASARADVDFVLPVHPNPGVRGVVRERLARRANVALVDPMPHAAFARLLARAAVAVTDSGGIQEEAPSLGLPCLVLRERSERNEALGGRGNRLVGREPVAVEEALGAALDAPLPELPRRPRPSVFGDGRAAQRIVAAIRCSVGLGARPEDFA